jgi:hypothetical protein
VVIGKLDVEDLHIYIYNLYILSESDSFLKEGVVKLVAIAENGVIYI